MSITSAPNMHRALLLAGILAGGCDGGLHSPPRVIPAATITLGLPGVELGRPAVEFNHGVHSEAMKEQGCTACHPKDPKGTLSPWLGRAEQGTDPEALTRHYHEKCMGCHKEQAAPRGKDLPLACGECHTPRHGKAKSARKRIRFDRSLHGRHVNATGEKECKSCHHVYNQERKALEYKEGAEGTCGGCHEAKDKGSTPSLRRASHDSCVGCHLDRASKKQASGPVLCAGCHARPAAKDGAAKDAALPRLMIGQKDRITMRAEGAEGGAVIFDHKLHEGTGTFCTTCHHSTTQGCAECHTSASGGKKAKLAAAQQDPAKAQDLGGGVTLERAHHLASSKHSCVGCHQAETRDKGCAGCHYALGKGPGQRSCKVCHTGEPTPAVATPAVATPAPTDGGAALAAAADPAAPVPAAKAPAPTDAALPPTSDDFPEQVEIKALARLYKPSMLPHSKIVASLDKLTKDSKLARRFHGGSRLLCAGCHHHSPEGQRPPACKSCHGERDQKDADRPNLKTAYHRQCIGCHQQMGIKKTGCTDCHAKASAPANKQGANTQKVSE